MRRNRTVIILALACALMGVPARAYASDGFLGGLEDLTGTRQVELGQEGYEESFQEEYEPELREVDTTPVRELPEDATTVDYVNDTVDAFNTVRWSVSNLDLLTSIRTIFDRFRENVFLPAAGIVFMLWGVRKIIRMIMAAFRKGSASV